MKIIIVDDCQVFRDGIKYYLENILSHEVIGTATNGMEFLQLININKADLILMDIKMPELNGFDTVKKAFIEFSHLIFIAITAYQDQTFLKDLICAGFKACVFKDDIYHELEKAMIKVTDNKLSFPKKIKIK